MKIPFVVYLEATMSANAAATLSYTVPPGETLTIFDVIMNATGACNITAIRDSSGLYYFNSNIAGGVAVEIFKEEGSAALGFDFKDLPITIQGGLIFYVELLDTSGGTNTVGLAFKTQRDTRA